MISIVLYFCNVYGFYTIHSCNNCPSQTPYCFENQCKECIVNHFCNSDAVCDRSCIDGTCVTNSYLNCTSLSKRCKIHENICVDCLEHTDCPSNRPYCDYYYYLQPNYKCEECFDDSHCQSDSNCNARCVGKKCISDYNIIDCTKIFETPKCNKDKRICQHCTLEGHCSNETFLKKCYNGECHQCTSHTECRHNGNCDAKCIEIKGKLVCNNSETPLVCCKDKECNLYLGECKPNRSSVFNYDFYLFLSLILLVMILE